MKTLTLALATFLSVSTVTAFGTVTSFSPPVGAVTKTAAASTDTFVSVALAQPAAWIGTVAASTGGTPTGTITAASSPNWSANAYAQASAMYYVRMLNGALQGHYFVIAGNDTQTLTVDTAGLDLTTLAAGDAMEVVPFWTLGTLYPASQAGTAFTASTSTLVRQTQLYFYDATVTGINRSATAVYFFYNGAWRKVGQSVSNSYNSTIIYPDTYFLQRNTAAATSLVYTGRVQPGSLGTILEASAAQNDNFVALSFPVDVTLNSSGLASAAFTASTSTLSLKDQLYWYDPAGTGTNRSATYVYFYYNGAWRRKGASVSTDYGSTVLKAGSGFIIRKAASGTTASWIFSTGI